jgi:hypothetical protein
MKRGIILLTVLFAGAASADLGSVVSSFRLSSASLPYVTGIMRQSHSGVVYWGALYSNGPDYLLQYNAQGSIIGSYILDNCTAPGDMDMSTGHNVYVLDTQRSALLEYVLTTGSFVGSRPVPPNTKGYAAFFEWERFLAIGTWVYYYDRNWSVVRSFNTSMDIGAIAWSRCLLNKEWHTVIVAPHGPGPFHCYYVSNGSHAASFAVPGSGTKGAHCDKGWAPYFYCNRLTLGGDMYLYKIDIDGLSAVAPASVGRVKALFR